MPEKKVSRQINLVSHIHTRGPIAWENHRSERHTDHNIECSTAYSRQCMEPQNLHQQLRAQTRCHAYILWTIPQPQKSATEITKLPHRSPQWWTLEDHTLSEMSQTKGKNCRGWTSLEKWKNRLKFTTQKEPLKIQTQELKKKNTVEDQDELEIGTNKYTESRYLKVYTKICIW